MRESQSMVILAGDVGGTNARLALFRSVKSAKSAKSGTSGVEQLIERTYPSAQSPGLDAIAEKFLAEAHTAVPDLSGPPERGCVGIAGPVEDNVCRATNLPWVVDGNQLAKRLSIPRLCLVNDFYAAALGCLEVPPERLTALGGGAREPKAPVAVVGAGTGLGEAFLLWSPTDNRYQVISSEGGHVDFAPRTPLESDLLLFLKAKYGRVSYERVLSGHGLVDLYAFLSEEPAFRALEPTDTAAAMAVEDPAKVITRRGLDGSDPVCAAALNVFCSVLGAVAGNLALTLLARGGVFVAGGIAPRLLSLLQGGMFREAFENKGRLQPLVAEIPAFLVMHAQPGLLGAATIAASL